MALQQCFIITLRSGFVCLSPETCAESDDGHLEIHWDSSFSVNPSVCKMCNSLVDSKRGEGLGQS